MYEHLKEALLPGGEIVRVEMLLLNLRMNKSENEIRLIREGCRINELVFEDLLNTVTPEMTEMEVAGIINSAIYKYGGEGPNFSAFGVVDGLEFVEVPVDKNASAEAAIKGKRNMYFNGAYVESTVYDRAKMAPGCTIKGPAIIEEYAASTPIPPKFTASIDGFRNIIITL